MGRSEHSVSRKELVQELGLPEIVIEAALLYMDVKGWIGSLMPSKLKISVAGIELVEDEKRFGEEFESSSNVVLIFEGSGLGDKGEGFEQVYEVVDSAAVSEEEKKEVRALVEAVERELEEMGPALEEIKKSVALISEKAEWLKPGIVHSVCHTVMERLT